MPEALMTYLVSGQFWAAAFLAFVAAFYWGVNNTGTTDGHLKWQVNLASTANKIKFLTVFFVFAVLLNVALIIAVAGLGALGVV